MKFSLEYDLSHVIKALHRKGIKGMNYAKILMAVASGCGGIISRTGFMVV